MKALEQVITAPEAVILSGLGLRTIQRMCKSGKLVCRNAGTDYKPVWLILKSSVDKQKPLD
jgi:hypothetical protein